MTLSDFAGWNGLFLLIPLLIALVDVAKRMFPGMRKRVKPALALLFGVRLSLFLSLALGLAILDQLWWGLIAGLGATGTYKLGKQAVYSAGRASDVVLGEGTTASGGSESMPDHLPQMTGEKRGHL